MNSHTENYIRNLIREEINRKANLLRENINDKGGNPEDHLSGENNGSKTKADETMEAIQKLIALYFDQFGPMIGDSGPLNSK